MTAPGRRLRLQQEPAHRINDVALLLRWSRRGLIRFLATEGLASRTDRCSHEPRWSVPPAHRHEFIADGQQLHVTKAGLELIVERLKRQQSNHAAGAL